MWFSLIVPTRNRVGSLKRLLESFDVLEWPDPVHVELLVVDNGSTDETASFLLEEQMKPRKCSFRVLQESRKGKASALNLALVSAKGNLILVVDDDVVVHPQWLVRHLECHRTTVFDAIQGRVLPGVDLQGKPADRNKLHEYNIPLVDYGEEVREIRGLVGTNMSFKREVFEKVGSFDVRLGPGASGFSEDTEYSMRIRKAGLKIGYTPNAVVYHELDPDRYGRGYNRMVHYRKGLSRSIYRQEPILLKIIPNLFVNLIRYGIYRLAGKSEKLHKTEGRILRYWGYLVGRVKGREGKKASAL